ncbi:MAG: DUF1353 domain-containing protein [Gammaproteobacteria bacterium]|nr:MAG: DUF1353 domain-containing protein [Gammaproteobacteria bacterium]
MNLIQTIRWVVVASLLSSCSFPPKPQTLPERDFVSDGCSLWPDGDIADCCVRHDYLYWQGGSPAERKRADQSLRRCVTEKGHPLEAWTMYVGVRLGGHGWLPTPFRWGFGYDWPRGYFESAPIDMENEHPDANLPGKRHEP